MERIITIILIVSFMALNIGCGDTKRIDGYEYDTYGLLNESEKKNPNIEYRVIVGNIIWSAILVETVIAPIYFLGFSIYEPVDKKNKKGKKPKGAL